MVLRMIVVYLIEFKFCEIDFFVIIEINSVIVFLILYVFEIDIKLLYFFFIRVSFYN